MFNTPTVFILGAGASWHYGYPTGEELVRRIVEAARQLAVVFREWEEYRIPFSLAFVEHIEERGDIACLSQAQREAGELASRLEMANPTLIDYFLKQNADLHDIGRLVIALVLLDCEAEFAEVGGNPNRRALLKRLARQGLANDVTIDPKAFNDDWLRFVLFKLTSGCDVSKDLHRNKVHFVTFNYDVSLERRLCDGLSAIKLFKQTDIDKFFADRRVHHVYGKLRDEMLRTWSPMRMTLPGSLKARSFDECREIRRRLDVAYKASRGIRTIDGPDKVADAETLGLARNAIAAAQKVFILGYGFDQANGRRISLELLREPAVNATGRSIFFTNYGGHNRVSMAASRKMFKTPEVFLPPHVPMKAETRHGLPFRFEMSTKNVYDALNEDFESLETD